ncbi:MAG: putative CheW protein [Frankiales bacterium]|jgi:purine-binding chemotaxis protein CheW|nr:putative CheW protein [Frankiales bacterium]
MSSTTTTMNQFSTFRVADQLFGVDVGRVQEVIRYQPMTPVPMARPAVAGLINLRGQVVTAVDLRVQLGLPPRAEGELPLNVVVRTGEEAVSLLVDSIGDVVDTTGDLFEAPPETVSGPARELISGAYKLEGKLLLALDVDRAVDVDRTS